MPANKTEELLTEIRDLLQLQRESELQHQKSVQRSQNVAYAMMALKGTFYIGTIVFTIIAAYFYYSTILSMTAIR
jgi:hypothetical protein